MSDPITPESAEPLSTASATSAAFGSLDVAPPELIRSIVDHSPTMLAYFDSGLICQYGNASYRRVFETPDRPLHGALFETLVQPNMREVIMPRALAALAGTPQEFEYERTAVNGQRIYVEVKYTPDVRQDKVVGMFVELHDITTHKRIEDLVLEANRDLEERVQERSAKLFESEERFRLMVDGLQDYCIYFLDELGHITDWTESAQRLHGLPAPQALRQHVNMLIDSSQPTDSPWPDLHALIQDAVDNGQSQTDGWQIRQHAAPFWAHTTFTALRNNHGELQGVSAITRDMTEQKRLDAMMNRLNHELEQRVEERSRELMLANRDIDAFSHMMSHDLRAPLRHISGYLTLLRDDLREFLTLDQQTAIFQHLSAIDHASKRLSHMLESVLEYARLGRTTITLVSVPLGPLVQAAVNQAMDLAGSRPIEWVMPDAWPVVMGDATLLSKLFTCLLDNAVKYTSRQPDARIELGWRPVDANDPTPSGFEHSLPRVTIWIKDNGAGFDSQNAHNLYVMFQRQHHSMDFEGAGTGLALSQRIASLHRGALRIKSQRGEGCLVNLVLPVANLST